jgi:hypothetical protein
VATGLAISAGLASRKFPGLLPTALGKYHGDALWAMMVFFGLCALLPTRRTAHLAASALAACYAVEVSQLYHAPWIDGIRANTLGHLVLGSTFNWPDLFAYTAGIVLAAVLDRYVPQWYHHRAE